MSKFNLDVSPYFDDYKIDKDYIRILFRPGFALQARELTQVQSILQNQISQFGDHVFKEGSHVLEGGITRSTVSWVVIDTANSAANLSDISTINGLELTGTTSGVTAKVLSTDSSTDIKYALVQYQNEANGNSTYVQGETLYLNTDAAVSPTIIAVVQSGALADVIGQGMNASVASGTYYIDGIFTRITDQTIFILDATPPTSTPTTRVGFTVNTTTVDSATDITLNDNSRGTSNSGAPGADRLKKELILSHRGINEITDENFVEVYRLLNGEVQKNTSSEAQYNEILDTLARRTSDESGDYAINPFAPNVREALTEDLPTGEAADEHFIVSLAPSKAYVSGYEIETYTNTDKSLEKARGTTDISIEKNFQEIQSVGRFYNIAASGTTSSTIDSAGAQEALEFNTDDFVELYKSGTSFSADHDNVSATDLTASDLIGIARARVHENGTAGVNKLYLYDIKMFTNISTTLSAAQVTAFAEGRYVSTDSNFTSGVSGYILNSTTSSLNILDTSSVLSTNDTLNLLETSTNGTLDLSGATITAYTVDDVLSIKFKSQTITNDYIGLVASGTASGLKGILSPALSVNENTINTIDPTNTVQLKAEFLVPSASTRTDIIGSASTTEHNVGDYAAFNFVDGDASSVMKINTFTTVEKTILRDRTSSTVVSHGWSVDDKHLTLEYADTHTIHAIYESPAIGTSFIGDTLELGSDHTLGGTNSEGNILEGISSGATARLIRLTSGTSLKLEVQLLTGSFQAGETVRNITQVSNPTVILNTTAHFTPTNSTNIINNYLFDDGQRDNFYTISRLIRKVSGHKPVGQLFILASRWNSNDYTNPNLVYISANSYSNSLEIDVRYSALTTDLSETIRRDYRPTGTNLRNVIDYRLYFEPKLVTTASNFYIKTNTILERSQLIPGTNLNYNYNNYLPRIDIISLHSDGDFIIKKGLANEVPQRPSTPEDAMLVNVVNIPPFTRYVDDVIVDIVDNRRYTMKDIGNLDKRLQNVEEATVLSLLESKAQQTDIRSALDATTARFKTGFITDDFSTLFTTEGGKQSTLAADADSPLFSASFDTRNGVLRPEAAQAVVDMVETSTPSEPTEDSSTAPTGYTVRNLTDGLGSVISTLAMLNYTTDEYIKQQFASSGVLINPYGHWKYIGILTVNPPSDSWKDTNRERYQDLFFVAGIDGPVTRVQTTEFMRGGLGRVTLSGNYAQSGSDYLITNITLSDGTTPSDNNPFTLPNGQYSFDGGLAITISDIDNTNGAINGFPIRSTSITLPASKFTYPNGFSLASGPTSGSFSVTVIRGTDADTAKPISIIGGRYVQNTNRWNDWETSWTGERQEIISLGNRTFEQRRIESFTQTNTLRTQGEQIATKKDVSDKLVETETQEWIRSSSIIITAINMKPNAVVQASFDNRDITSECIQFTDAVSRANLKPSSGNLVTDGTGAIALQYQIPFGQFKVGTRSVILKNLGNDTQATGNYTATGITEFRRIETTLSRTLSRIDDSTQIGSNDFTTTSTVRQWQTPAPRPTREERQREQREGGGRQERQPRDPIAQSFFVEETNDIFVTGVDVYFHTVDGTSRSKTAVERELIIVNDYGISLVDTTVSGTDTSSTVATKLASNGIDGTIINEIVTKWDAQTVPGNTYVEFEIRNTENGYPGGRVITESKVRLTLPTDGSTSGNDNTIYQTNDATIPTKVRFEAPIQLDQGEHYCFVLLSPNNIHSVWVAKSGEADITTGNTINKAPYIGSFFKSENAVTWIPDPTSDMKFTINRAKFSTVDATMTLANETTAGTRSKFRFPGRDLQGSAVATTSGSHVVTITTSEPHGMKEDIRVRMDGIIGNNSTRTTLGGIPVNSGSQVNGNDFPGINTKLISTNTVEGIDYHLVKNPTLYTFDIELYNDATADKTSSTNQAKATSTIAAGNTEVVITADIQYDVLRPNIKLVSDQKGFTAVTQSVKAKPGLTSGHTATSVDPTYGIIGTATEYPINENIYFDYPQVITNDVSSRSENSFSTKSLEIDYKLSSDNNNYSPILDVHNTTTVNISNIVAEDNNYFSYVTKEITLNNAADSVHVIFDANIHPENTIEFRVKTLADGSSNSFEDQEWRLFSTLTGNTSNELFEEYSVATDNTINGGFSIDDFTSFAIQIRCKSTNSSRPPLFKDLRMIATAG